MYDAREVHSPVFDGKRTAESSLMDLKLEEACMRDRTKVGGPERGVPLCDPSSAK